MHHKINPGDVWIVSLKDTIGHEMLGERPAIVVAIHVETELVTVIPLTSNLEASRFPYTLKIKKTYSNGLRTDSIALIFQIRSLSYKRFIKRIGYIDALSMKRMKALLKDYLGL